MLRIESSLLDNNPNNEVPQFRDWMAAVSSSLNIGIKWVWCLTAKPCQWLTLIYYQDFDTWVHGQITMTQVRLQNMSTMENSSACVQNNLASQVEKHWNNASTIAHCFLADDEIFNTSSYGIFRMPLLEDTGNLCDFCWWIAVYFSVS